MMDNQSETNISENLKLYDEILAIKRLLENQESDLSIFDLTLSSLPVDITVLLHEFSTLIFQTGLQNIDHFNLEILFYEAIKERIKYVRVIKDLQLENQKWEECVDRELMEIKSIEEGKADLLKNILPISKLDEEIDLLEKQILAMQKKQSQFSSSALKCIDHLLTKLDQIDIKKNVKETSVKK